ncbi:DUF2156 domain-containing protein [Candidatus Margulisiibacteriota bacterium]
MSIPVFPEFRQITKEDKQDIEQVLLANNIEIAELTFPNMFAWREYDHPEVSILNDNLLFLSAPWNEPSCRFMMPIGTKNIVETIRSCLQYLVREKECKKPHIARLPENIVKEYKLEEHFICEADRDNSDYVYQVSDLAELKGRKYDGKRNHIKKVKERGDYQYKDLTIEDIGGCKKVLAAWAKHKFKKEEVDNLETLIFGEKALYQYLDNFEYLGLCGGVIVKADKVVAFTLASRLNKDTAVTYAETSLPEEKGLNQLLNQEFCQKGLKEFKYVNREQDLGHPGLRKAKMSYQPHHLVNKYNVRPK